LEQVEIAGASDNRNHASLWLKATLQLSQHDVDGGICLRNQYRHVAQVFCSWSGLTPLWLAEQSSRVTRLGRGDDTSRNACFDKPSQPGPIIAGNQDPAIGGNQAGGDDSG
jgi:hypothetical protein